MFVSAFTQLWCCLCSFSEPLCRISLSSSSALLRLKVIDWVSASSDLLHRHCFGPSAWAYSINPDVLLSPFILLIRPGFCCTKSQWHRFSYLRVFLWKETIHILFKPLVWLYVMLKSQLQFLMSSAKSSFTVVVVKYEPFLWNVIITVCRVSR